MPLSLSCSMPLPPSRVLSPRPLAAESMPTQATRVVFVSWPAGTPSIAKPSRSDALRVWSVSVQPIMAAVTDVVCDKHPLVQAQPSEQLVRDHPRSVVTEELLLVGQTLGLALACPG